MNPKDEVSPCPDEHPEDVYPASTAPAGPGRADEEERESAIAISRAARLVERHLLEGVSGPGEKTERPQTEQGRSGAPLDRGPVANTLMVKQAAVRLGADLVGTCRLDRAWLTPSGRTADVPSLSEACKFVVVMAVTMNVDDIARSPEIAASAATSVGYMRAAVCSSAVTAFIRQLGWQAVGVVNALASSVPLAVKAGLGKVGRHGLLITSEFGPCVRLCKVFTDMPLDDGAAPGDCVENLCRTCVKCAEACPVGAITFEPSFCQDPTSAKEAISPWPPVNGTRCRGFWKSNGNSCSTCVAACPFTQSLSLGNT